MSPCSTPLFLCTFLLSCYILIVPGQSASSDKYIDSSQKLDTRGDGISGAGNNIRSLGSHRNLRSVYGFGPRMMQISRSKIPIELDLLIDNETNDNERTKRFDDYGHMRFGKRGGEDQFDDYGHMRFGRR